MSFSLCPSICFTLAQSTTFKGISAEKQAQREEYHCKTVRLPNVGCSCNSAVQVGKWSTAGMRVAADFRKRLTQDKQETADLVLRLSAGYLP